MKVKGMVLKSLENSVTSQVLFTRVSGTFPWQQMANVEMLIHKVGHTPQYHVPKSNFA